MTDRDTRAELERLLLGNSTLRQLRAVALLTTMVLALPAAALFAAIRLTLVALRHIALRRGFISCPSCAAENPTVGLATCRRCGTTEFGSLLSCSRCGLVSTDIPCLSCTASIRVL